MEDRTQDGRKVRMLKAVDEFSRERLAIRVGRRLKAGDLVDALADARSKIEVWPRDYNERLLTHRWASFPLVLSASRVNSAVNRGCCAAMWQPVAGKPASGGGALKRSSEQITLDLIHQSQRRKPLTCLRFYQPASRATLVQPLQPMT